MTQSSGKTNFSVTETGGPASWDENVFTHPALKKDAHGKLFLKDVLDLSSCEMSVNSMPPGHSMPFSHKHRQNEEVYLFIQGVGEFQIDGQVFPVKSGSVVRISPEAERCYRNISDKDHLAFVVIQAPEGGLRNSTVSDGIPVSKRVQWPA
jgi:mannose-6-phosphate isomerase-like protein (cupin superfamily)